MLLVTILAQAQGPTYEWANSVGGSLPDQSNSIVTDIIGNIYTTGSFNGSVDFDSGVGVSNLTAVGSNDIYILKTDPLGNFLWVRQMGGVSNDQGLAINIDNSGNIYSVGYFQGTVDFDPGAGVQNLTSAGGSFDNYIQKLDPFGNLVWVKKTGGPLNESVYSISIDSFGNLITCGRFEGTVDFDPGAGVFNFVSYGSYDFFIQKLDSLGNFVWAKQMGGTSSVTGRYSTIDTSDNIYSIGFFEGTVDFDPSIAVQNLTSAGSHDIFIQKLNSAGNFQWVKQMGGSLNDFGLSISTDIDGNVYTTGYFEGTVDFDPGIPTQNLSSYGASDIFIQKLDLSGNLLWVNQLGGSSQDNSQSITTDSYGNAYIFGHFNGTADFDPSINNLSLTSSGSNDLFIEKIDSSGNLIWVKQIGGPLNDIGTAVCLDNSGNIYATGAYNGTVDFDPNLGIDNHTSLGSFDSFFFKLNECIATSFADAQVACDTYTWPLNSTTYTNSTNTPSATLTNAAGCDSIVTLNLTINNSTSGTDTQVACDTYTWPLNSTTYTNSTNTPTAALTNAAGCDSVVTLDLTITNSTSGTDTQTACDSYFWIDGNTYTSDNNTATHTLTNTANCDSVVTLDLTINTVDSSVTQSGVILSAVVAGASYQWLNCNNDFAIISGETNQNYTATSNGNYAVEITQNGCVDTSSCYSITSVGIIENNFGNDLLLYPNPTNGNFSIDLGSNYQTVTITMTDLNGKLIQSKKYNKIQLLNMKLEKPAGIYLLMIESGDKKAVIRLVKE